MHNALRYFLISNICYSNFFILSPLIMQQKQKERLTYDAMRYIL